MGLKIGMITTHKVRCGIASYTENLSKALAKAGVDVYILRIPRYGPREPSLFQMVINHIDRIKDELDIIHVQDEYGLYGDIVTPRFFPMLKEFGKPIVTTMHAAGQYEADTIIAENSDKIIVHNEFCADRFGREEGKVEIIPHGMTPLKTPLPPRDVCKKRIGIQPMVPVVGYVGFISHYKGIELLLEAMVDVPKTGLLVGGGWFIEQETAYIVSLRERANELLPSRNQWLGYINDEDLPMVYGAMDIVVYPSRFMTESGAMLMALSHGKAVIASNLPPVREKEKTGALITFKDVKDLSEKINTLLKDKAMCYSLENNAKKFTEENSWSNIAQRHKTLYEELLHM